jgi:ribosomal protein L11 methyltransferase
MTDRLEASTTALTSLDVVARVVVANIEARVLVPMAKELERHVAPGGLLLLSGILLPQRDEVRAAYPGMELLGAPAIGEWTLLALRQPA